MKNNNKISKNDFCQILVNEKRSGDYLQSHQCKNIARFYIRYKLSSKSENIKVKTCCTIHKKMFLRQIDKDDFAELVSCENIR